MQHDCIHADGVALEALAELINYHTDVPYNHALPALCKRHADAHEICVMCILLLQHL